MALPLGAPLIPRPLDAASQWSLGQSIQLAVEFLAIPSLHRPWPYHSRQERAGDSIDDPQGQKRHQPVHHTLVPDGDRHLSEAWEAGYLRKEMGEHPGRPSIEITLQGCLAYLIGSIRPNGRSTGCRRRDPLSLHHYRESRDDPCPWAHARPRGTLP